MKNYVMDQKVKVALEFALILANLELQPVEIVGMAMRLTHTFFDAIEKEGWVKEIPE